MISPERQVLLLILAALGIFTALYSLGVVLNREWVKDDLREKCFRPLGVQWHPLAWWGGFYGTCFEVRYEDLAGLVHKARCWTIGITRNVHWVSDEVIGD